MEDQDDGFLDVRLDQTGAAYLKKLLTTTRWLFIMGMFLVLLLIANGILRISYMNAERFSSNLPLYLEIKLYNWYTFIYSLFFSWQIWCYLQFARLANKGADLLDTAQFNRSFRTLYRSNTLAIVHLSFSIVMGMLEVGANYNLSKMLLHR